MSFFLNEDSRVKNIQKLFSTLNLNYEEIVKKAGGVQLERMVLDGVVSRFKVKVCNSCGGSLEELSRAEGDLLEVKSNMDKIFKDLKAVDRSNTLQAMQIAQLCSKACEDVLIAESKPIKIRRKFCKKVVKALEEEGKLEDFIKEKPSSAYGYFVEAFVLNLRLELSEQCKADLNLHSEEAQAVLPPQPGTSSRSPSIGAPAKSASPVPSSSTPRDSINSYQPTTSSTFARPTLQTFETTEISDDTNSPGPSPPPVLHLQSSKSASSDLPTEKRKRAAHVKATGKMAEVIDALKSDPEVLKSGFVYKHRQHFHVHNERHFTCRYCREELTAGKSVRGKAWHHFFKFHFKGQKATTQLKKKTAPISAMMNHKTGKTGLPRGRKRDSAFKYREHFNCKGISSFDCKYCSKSYVGKDVRQAARLHFLRKHSNSKNGVPQGLQKGPSGAVHQRQSMIKRVSMPGRGWSSPQGFVNAQEHFNFQGKTFCVCKYCKQSYSGTYCGNAARLHFLGTHYQEWKDQESSLQTGQYGSPQKQDTTPRISKGKTARSQEMEEDVSQDEPEVASLSYSPLSIEEDTSASLTPKEKREISSDIEASLNNIRHGCGICGEHFESQSDADKHFAEKHMKFERFYN